MGAIVFVMSLHPVTNDTFTAEVLESDKPVLVDFWAAWCAPCRTMTPVLEQIAASRTDLKVVSVDAEAEQELAARCGVQGMPTFMLFADGAPIHTRVGATPRRKLESELEEALKQHTAVR
jgi:thioredoxin 1